MVMPVADKSSHSTPLEKHTKLGISSILPYTRHVVSTSGRWITKKEQSISGPIGLATRVDNESKKSLANMSISPFLKLPVEVRLLIYEYFFGSREIVVHGRGRMFSLLGTCKAITLEAMPVYLGKGNFVVTEKSLPDPKQFPKPAQQVSHLTVMSSSPQYVDAFCNHLAHIGCKIPHLTISGSPMQDLFCSYLQGNPGACCAKTFTLYLTYVSGTRQDVIQNICKERQRGTHGVRNAVILIFAEDAGDWVCTNLYMVTRDRLNAGMFFDRILYCARERKWLLTADIHVTLVQPWPYQHFKAEFKREDEVDEDRQPIIWFGEKTSDSREWHDYRVVSYQL